MKNLLDKYKTTINLLNCRSRVEIKRATIARPASEEIINRAEELMKMSLGNEVKTFYKTANGFTIEWTMDKPGDKTYLLGWIDIWPLEKMICGESGNLGINEEQLKRAFEETLILDNETPEALSELTKHRMVESHWGYASYTTLRFDPLTGIKLYYVDNYGQYPLPMSFEEYIDFTFESLGVDGCRQQLKHKEFYLNPYNSVMELARVKEEFPETDLRRIHAFCH